MPQFKNLKPAGFCLCFLLFGLFCRAQIRRNFEPDSSIVRVAKNNQMFYTLITAKDTSLTQQIIKHIKQNPNAYIPPILYAAASQMFQSGHKNEAVYWFFLAQLRAEYDANLGIEQLQKHNNKIVFLYNNAFGRSIVQHAFMNLDKLKSTIQQVTDYVKNHNGKYNHYWIYFDGGAPHTLNDLSILTKPKKKWKKIKKQTLKKFKTDFDRQLFLKN